MPEFVFVACKLPNGLHLDVFPESTINGETVFNVAAKSRVTVQGSAKFRGMDLNDPSQEDHNREIRNGFGITPVPKDHWEAWIKQNKNSTLLKDGFIFASVGVRNAEDQAKEKSGIITGFEPINPDNHSVVGVRTAA